MQPALVVIADQVRSRHEPDRVPAALERLAPVPVLLPFERTAGDEIQALVCSPEAAVASLVALSREGGWQVGVGIGAVDGPLPRTTRAARGSAYLAARAAVAAAKGSRTGVALRTVTGDGYGAEEVLDAEAALWLLWSVLGRRTEEGWQIVDLHDEGLTGIEAATRLGISPSAASQRLRRSAYDEARAGARLAARLLAHAIGSGS